MIAELDVGHAYVSGGESFAPPRPPAMLIGASFELDHRAGRYRIARVLAGDNSDPLYRSPLTEVGVDVAEGDYLLAVNGIALDHTENPYALLREQAGPIVELFVSPTPRRADGRAVRIETRDSEQPLRYYERVMRNRDAVDRLSDGRIGYLHLPDMGPSGLREFIRSYYGQIRRDGLIVDVRGNGGGNVSQMILERLFRKPYSLGYVQGERYPRVYPWGMGGNRVFTGEIAVVADETTLSDGEAFTWTFQQAGRGPVIGARTWGGVIGIDDTGATVDGGALRVPQFALADTHGQWVVEGTGVVPDIPVENSPVALAEGRDPQLERAVEELLRMLGNDRPGRLASPAPGPDKRASSDRSGQ
jgi:tricorn protease